MGSSQSNETLEFLEKDGYYYWADFEKTPFAEGVSRYAYKGTFHGQGPSRGDRCVVKVFKQTYAKHITEWTTDIAASKRAQELAEQWNVYKSTTRPPRFRIPVIAKMDKLATFYALGFIPISQTSVIGVNEYVAIEDFITGDYEKFNSNSGWVNRNGHLFASAFSHYTWHKTNGRELVCDLQGVRKGDSYELTDPAVHSLNRLYGMTDLGQLGMDAFFYSHQCNELCYGLPLPAGHVRHAAWFGQRNTSYTFEL